MISAGASLVVRLVNLFGAIGLLGTLLGFAASYHWMADVAVQLRVQYLIMLVPAVVMWALQRRRVLAGVAALAVAVNAWPVVPYFIAPDSRAIAASESPRPGQPGLRLMVFNVLRTNENIDTTLEEVVREEADFLFLMEISPVWEPRLRELRDRYPHQQLLCRHDYTGVAFLSKYPWSELEVLDMGDANLPLDIRFPPVGGQPARFRLIATHPLPPFGPFLTGLRDRQLIALAKRVRGDQATLLVGDFNLSPWSPRFQKVLAAGRLRDASLGYGISPTLTPLPTLMGGVKVDHVLVNSGVTVRSYRLHASADSDHRRLIVEFDVAKTKPQGDPD